MKRCEESWGFDLFYHAKSLWWLCFITRCLVLMSEQGRVPARACLWLWVQRLLPPEAACFVCEDISDWRLRRENAKQPRAVFTSKIYPPIFSRQILLSVNMASKVKAWLHSNKCSMCMPWVNYVHVIFISSEYDSIYYCVLASFN